MWPLNPAFPNTTQTGHKIISNRRWLNFELKLTTIHCKCLQTHRVSLPSSSQNLAAKCASKKKKGTISNRRWLNFKLKLTTIHCKCSQTDRLSLPSSSQKLAAKCASKKNKQKKTEIKQIHDRPPGSFPMFPSSTNPSPVPWLNELGTSGFFRFCEI